MAMRGSLSTVYYETLRQNFRYLCREIDAEHLLGHLFERGVLSADDIQEISAQVSQGKRTRELIFKLFLATDKGYDKFIEILKEDYKHVASTLEGFTPTLPAEEGNNSDSAPVGELEQLSLASGASVKESKGVPGADQEQLSPARGIAVERSEGAPVGELEQLSLACGASVKESEAKSRNHGHSLGHPQSLTPEKAIELHKFEHGSLIVDVAFLRCGIVIADFHKNLCLYTEEGRRLHEIKCDDPWWCGLALLSEPLVALVKANGKELQVLHVTRQGFEIKVTEKLQKEYRCLAAVDEKTLAAASFDDPEIDLINLSGVVLKTIQLTGPAYRLCVNSDRIMIARTHPPSRLIKIHLDQGTEVLLQKDPQIPYGLGVSALPGGCFVVGDDQRKTLCLMTEDGQWIRDLVSLKDKIRGGLAFVSVCGEKVVCSSIRNGEIFVLSFV